MGGKEHPMPLTAMEDLREIQQELFDAAARASNDGDEREARSCIREADEVEAEYTLCRARLIPTDGGYSLSAY
jgi:cob(I)alamin adenosyltransferase